MILTELIDHLRMMLDDTTEPYLWSTAELTIFINRAQLEAADRADLLIEEGNATYCNRALIPGTAYYILNPVVTEVRNVYLNGILVEKKELLELNEMSSTWQTDTYEEGVYYFYKTGQRIRIVPTPQVAGTIEMIVKRLPTEIVDTLDIPERYHLDILDWAVYLAYMKNDTDIQGPDAELRARARFHQQKFASNFGPGTTVELDRKAQNIRRGINSHWI